MAIRIKIKFDGTAEGLAQHRLELGAFGEVLSCFVAGLRRTASGIVTEAIESSRGRLARGADLRVFLEGISGNSLALNVAVEPEPLGPGQVGELVDSLTERAATRFVFDIEHESQGRLRNRHARKFLRAIPPGVTLQNYEVWCGDQKLCETTIKSVELPTEPQDLPVLIKSRARVIGLTFEPSAEVRLDVEGTKLSFSVTEDDLEKSILLRGQDAFAVALIRGNKGRLLWIGNPNEVPRQLTPDERSSHILSRWEKTLERLAQ